VINGITKMIKKGTYVLIGKHVVGEHKNLNHGVSGTLRCRRSFFKDRDK
jgi:hypothetical protein